MVFFLFRGDRQKPGVRPLLGLGSLFLLLGDPLGIRDSSFAFLAFPSLALGLGLNVGLKLSPLRIAGNLMEPCLPEQILHFGEARTAVSEQVGRAPLIFPVARSALEPIQQAQRVLVLLEPSVEVRPRAQQRFVRDLDRLVSPRIAVGHKQAKVDKGVKQYPRLPREVGEEGAPAGAYPLRIHTNKARHEGCA